MDIIQGEQRYQLIKLKLDTGESIETTAEHPFYIKGKGWHPANSLKVGEALQLHNGTTVVIKQIETGIRVEKVYNLTVANTHNYFVGENGVLVHNCPGGGGSGRGRTEHGKQRKQEAKTDSHRDVGDPNKVIRDGKKYTDSETGYDVYVDGERVVIVKPNGDIHTQFKNPKANTQKRIQSGKWVLPDPFRDL